MANKSSKRRNAARIAAGHSTKGRAVNSSQERRIAGRKPWQGCPMARRKDGVPKFRFY